MIESDEQFLKAGYSFLQAVELVSREMNPPISREFSGSTESLGATVEEALRIASRFTMMIWSWYCFR